MDRVLDFPSSADSAGELHPRLVELRSQDSLPRVLLADGQEAWLVTRHEDVRTVLNGRSFTRDVMGVRARRSGQEPGSARSVNMDGRPHTELRALVSRAFAVRRIEAMTPRIQSWTDDLLDAMEAEGPPADLVAHLAVPLPALAICELLGFPVEDRDTLSGWCDRITAIGDGAPDQKAWLELTSYIERQVPVKRAARGDGLAPDADILTRLVHAHDSDNALSLEELLSLTVVVLAGGLETTQTAISAGMLRLFRNPEQLDKLRADPDLVVPAVEELLRYQPVIDVNRVQIATEAVRLGGQQIREGDLVQVSINAANRDETVFPDSERCDITRGPNPHLAFGYGAHHCLGAALARLELHTAFSTLLRRFPNLRPAVPPESLSWRGGHVTLRLEELPVAW
ncbi:cytochrome P450 [Streptomyces rishiriensis]|uniref:Cytochrome P450 n=1 Tax=Streptomyces rishiriensis TaxID=68264 RepID=A0ABU0P4H3_STRRH|nr:cytochrome P450 [Streptomyces rishiriensis]MDQ0585642.1 cytochrome P450 [Streptomyces rishiriensis]